MHGAGFQLMEERLMESKEKKFDPATILLLITTLIPLIANCFNPTPKVLRRRLGNRARVAASIRRDSNVSWGEAFTQADHCFDCADKVTDEELQLVIDDCCK